MRNEKGQFVKGNNEWVGRKHHPNSLAKMRGKKGHTAWNKGKIGWTKGTKAGFQKGNKLGDKTGSRATPETIKKLRESHIGLQVKENHWNWKGGVSPIAEQIRKCFKNRQWKSDIFERDNYTCVLCEKRGGSLEVDHYPKMFSTIFHENKIKSLEQALECEEFWNINNGRVLCSPCHNKTKKKI